MSVDLPAPFSPMRLCTSPGKRRKLTSSSALTPGNSIEIPVISTIGGDPFTAPPSLRDGAGPPPWGDAPAPHYLGRADFDLPVAPRTGGPAAPRPQPRASR